MPCKIFYFLKKKTRKSHYELTVIPQFGSMFTDKLLANIHNLFTVSAVIFSPFAQLVPHFYKQTRLYYLIYGHDLRKNCKDTVNNSDYCVMCGERCLLHCDAATANANAMVVMGEHATDITIRGTRQKSVFFPKKRHFSTNENTNANTEHGCECIVIITIQTIRVN